MRHKRKEGKVALGGEKGKTSSVAREKLVTFHPLRSFSVIKGEGCEDRVLSFEELNE